MHVVTIEMDEETIARIDALASKFAAQRVGVRREEIMRVLLRRSLEQVQAEREELGKEQAAERFAERARRGGVALHVRANARGKKLPSDGGAGA